MIEKIIFLGIDSLRGDRMTYRGYKYETSPTLSLLAEEGLTCLNAYTPSGPTQPALPAIFTSTLPLDFGGYDNDATSRPDSIATSLKNLGYEADGVICCPWMALSGFGKEFDSCVSAYDISLLWDGSFKVYLDFYKKALIKGEIVQEDFIILVGDWLERHFELSIQLCQDRASYRSYKGQPDINYYKSFFNHDYEHLLVEIIREYDIYKNSRHGYVLNLISTNPSFENLFRGRNNAKLLRTIHRNIIYSKRQSKDLIGYFYKRYWSAEHGMSRLIHRLNCLKGKKSFHWLLFPDVHDCNSSNKTGFSQYKNVNSLLEKSGISEGVKLDVYIKPSKYSSLLYDASVRYVDNQIGRLLSYLKETGMIEKTLLVVFADHGAHIGNEPNYVFSMNENYLSVPLLFYGAGVSSRKVSHNCGLIDILPTVYEILGVADEAHFKGKSVMSSDLEDRVLIHENLGPGPCYFKTRSINIAARYRDFTLSINIPNGAGKDYFDGVRETAVIESRLPARIAVPPDNRVRKILCESIEKRYMEIKVSKQIK